MVPSLFERLTMGPLAQSIDEDESIRNHLLRLLTTRQGTVMALPDYGLPDLNDLAYSKSELLAKSCRTISNCISRYEPRLTNVIVQIISDSENPLNVAFSISARKKTDTFETKAWQWVISLEQLKK
jgi:type VI secretion system protein